MKNNYFFIVRNKDAELKGGLWLYVIHIFLFLLYPILVNTAVIHIALLRAYEN